MSALNEVLANIDETAFLRAFDINRLVGGPDYELDCLEGFGRIEDYMECCDAVLAAHADTDSSACVVSLLRDPEFVRVMNRALLEKADCVLLLKAHRFLSSLTEIQPVTVARSLDMGSACRNALSFHAYELTVGILNIMKVFLKRAKAPNFEGVLVHVLAETGPSIFPSLERLDMYYPDVQIAALECISSLVIQLPHAEVADVVVDDLCYKFKECAVEVLKYKYPPIIEYLACTHFTRVFTAIHPNEFEQLLRNPGTGHPAQRFQRQVLEILGVITREYDDYPGGDLGYRRLAVMLHRVIREKPLNPMLLVHLYTYMTDHSPQLEEDEAFLMQIFGYAGDPYMLSVVRVLFKTYADYPTWYQRTLRHIARSGVIDWMASMQACQNNSYLKRKVGNLLVRYKEYDKPFPRAVSVSESKILRTPTLLVDLRRRTCDLRHILDDRRIALELMPIVTLSIRIVSLRTHDEQIDSGASLDFFRKLNWTVTFRFPMGYALDNGIEVTWMSTLADLTTRFNDVHNPYPQPVTKACKAVLEKFVDESQTRTALEVAYPPSRGVREPLNIVLHGHRLPDWWSIMDLPVDAELDTLNLTLEGAWEDRTFALSTDEVTREEYMFQSTGKVLALRLYDSEMYRLYKRSPADASVDRLRLSNDMWARLENPAESLSIRSHSIAYIHLYKLWFSFDIRLYAFKMRNFIFSRRHKAYCRRYQPRIAQRPLDGVTLSIAKERLYDEGMTALALFGMSPVPLDFSFTPGVCSTHEFISLLTRELSGRVLWHTAEGAFPVPDAGEEEMKILGNLFARALLMEGTTGVAMHPHFFFLLRSRRERNEMHCTDSYAEQVADNRAPYVIDSICPGEYSGDQLSRLCGGKLRRQIRGPFIDGFNAVLSFPGSYYCESGFESLACLFNDLELSDIFAGERHIFAEHEIADGISIRGGYGDNSPQIVMFKELLREMHGQGHASLFFFVTGMYYPPLGGLKALRPRFTVVPYDDRSSHADQQSPEAFIPIHTLAIPRYTSLAAMRTRFAELLVGPGPW